MWKPLSHFMRGDLDLARSWPVSLVMSCIVFWLFGGGHVLVESSFRWDVMMASGIKPNRITYNILISSCAKDHVQGLFETRDHHCGLVRECAIPFEEVKFTFSNWPFWRSPWIRCQMRDAAGAEKWMLQMMEQGGACSVPWSIQVVLAWRARFNIEIWNMLCHQIPSYTSCTVV